MGVCKGNGCCKDEEYLRTCDNLKFNRMDNNDLVDGREKLILKSGISIDYNVLNLNRKYVNIMNKIRKNPKNYIEESKSHNLFEIFLKLKPSQQIQFSDDNILDVISFLKENSERISVIQKEKEIAKIINDGNIQKLRLFQTIALGIDVEENFWYFLEENEDDIGKILQDNYDYIMIICLPLEEDRIIVTFIFYDVLN